MTRNLRKDKGFDTKYRKERLERCIKARSDTIYALSSYKEAVYLLFPRAVTIVGLLVLPLILPEYWTKVLVMTCVVALLALSWDFIAMAGMFSLGQTLFFGVGAYLAGALNHYLHLSPFIPININSSAHHRQIVILNPL